MKSPTHNNNKNLDELISRAISREQPEFDFDKWKNEHQKEIQMFKLQAVDRQISYSTLPFNICRTIMKSKITKIAAAAVIIIAVLIGMNQFTGSIDSSNVAWAEVVRNVEKIHTFTYKQTETTGPKEQDLGSKLRQTTVAYISSEYGLKEECYRNGQIHTIAYYLRPERMLVGISPQHKLYERRPLTEAELRGIDNRADTRWVVKKFMSVEHKKLGRGNINGLEVEGIEINDAKAFDKFLRSVDSFVGRLWVDVVTDLPVLIELEFVPAGSNLQTKLVVDEIKWNAELSKSVFEPNIPADYTLMEK